MQTINWYVYKYQLTIGDEILFAVNQQSFKFKFTGTEFSLPYDYTSQGVKTSKPVGIMKVDL